MSASEDLRVGNIHVSKFVGINIYFLDNVWVLKLYKCTNAQIQRISTFTNLLLSIRKLASIFLTTLLSLSSTFQLLSTYSTFTLM